MVKERASLHTSVTGLASFIEASIVQQHLLSKPRRGKEFCWGVGCTCTPARRPSHKSRMANPKSSALPGLASFVKQALKYLASMATSTCFAHQLLDLVRYFRAKADLAFVAALVRAGFSRSFRKCLQRAKAQRCSSKKPSACKPFLSIETVTVYLHSVCEPIQARL